MPRSNRAYGDPLPATLANAIAYVHASQQTKGVHMSTMSRLMDLYTFADRRPHYQFTSDALELAKSAPLWAAYQWCVDNGYRLFTMTRHDMRSIQYWNPEQEKYAYINRWGEVFIVPEDGKWAGRTQRFNPSKGETCPEAADTDREDQ